MTQANSSWSSKKWDKLTGAPWPWATLFIEIALRAIRRVHYDHGLWGIGRQWQMSQEKALHINTGRGIELADERAVCAAISQEFLSSPSVTGLWRQPSQPTGEVRFFSIEREKNYITKSLKDKTQKVDLYVEKYVAITDDQGSIVNQKLVRVPSFIEAKRARRYMPDIKDGTAAPGILQKKSIEADIKKLRVELEHRQQLGQMSLIHAHLLVWGLFGTGDRSDEHPVDFFYQFDENVVPHQLRWLPIEWNTPDFQDLKSATSCSLGIEQPTCALWIALAEVFPKDNVVGDQHSLATAAPQ